jgi:hypothetical protein
LEYCPPKNSIAVRLAPVSRTICVCSRTFLPLAFALEFHAKELLRRWACNFFKLEKLISRGIPLLRRLTLRGKLLRDVCAVGVV